MEWLKQAIKDHPHWALLFPTGIGSFNFFGSLLISLSDGAIDSVEFHNLLSSSSGLETVLLFIIMIALRRK